MPPATLLMKDGLKNKDNLQKEDDLIKEDNSNVHMNLENQYLCS